MGPEKTEVVVIGEGITGLSIAFWLKKYGTRAVMLAKDTEVGGTTKSIHEQGYIYETGATTALGLSPTFRELINDLKLEDRLIYAQPESKNRFILRDGLLRLVPMGLSSFITTKLFSPSAKLRLMKEPFIERSNREESAAEFFERRLGREFLDYAIDPFVAGTFAGKPEQLSIRSAFPELYLLEEKYGSLLKGMIKSKGEIKRDGEKAKTFSFLEGMQTLPNAIAASLGRSITYNAKVTNIYDLTTTRNEPINEPDARRYMVEYLHNGTAKKIEADFIIFAVPSYEAAAIIKSSFKETASTLASINYAPITSVFLGIKQEDVGNRLNGFGFLVPSKEKRQILGCIWNSSLFRNRAPAGFAAINVIIGGSRQPELTNLSDDRTIQITLDELKSIMQFSGKPIYLRIIRWNKSIPQYEIGHQQKIEALIQFEESHPGIVFTGNYRGGISMGNCVKNACETAKSVCASITAIR